VKKAPAKKAPARKRTTSRKRPPDPAKRWRPADRSGQVCGFSFGDKVCRKRGAHYCEPRADKVVGFCRVVLRHTTGPFARRPFVLEPWQEFEIIRPLFGEVIWSKEWGRYVRRYRVAYIVMARKNGKSALAAAIVLYLLVGDGEEAAEVYGAAKNTRQAGKVYQPVKRMVQLSPALSKRLKENKASRRIYDESRGSFYEVIPADAVGELGHNPHGFVLDEVLSQPNRDLWDTMRTALGARVQALVVAITTETNEPDSFGAELIDEAERIQEDPARSPHSFSWVRKTPKDVDPFVQKNWYHANPALGRFKSLEEMKKMALEARNDPAAKAAFLQLQLNMRQSVVTRWLNMPLWDAGATEVVEADLVGRTCFAGLDLASTTDLAAWVLRFPAEDGQPAAVLWRFWTPEAQLRKLDQATAGQASLWVAAGLMVATEGDWIDYSGDDTNEGRSGSGLAIHPTIAADAGQFRIVKVGYDQAQATATAQFMQGLGLDITPVPQGYGVSAALQEIHRLVKHDADAAKKGEPVLLGHGGHPVARWNVDSAEVRRDDGERIKLVKPDRDKSRKRIDGLAGLANAVKVELDYQAEGPGVVNLW
jgi:phage terminase large subunit-like protein